MYTFLTILLVIMCLGGLTFRDVLFGTAAAATIVVLLAYILLPLVAFGGVIWLLASM